jgi:hypothetical protein
MKNKSLITPEMKSSPSVFAEAQAFRKSANLILRPLASSLAILRGFNRRTSEDRKGRHQLKIRRGKRGPGQRFDRLSKVSSRWNIKNQFSPVHITARLVKRVFRGIQARLSWKDIGYLVAGKSRTGGSTFKPRTVWDPKTQQYVVCPKAPSRRDKTRAGARSHQFLKGCAA